MRKRFEVLDSFRGLSAIFVVMFHMHYVGSITELNFFKGSSLFVEFFFLLSGFVLAHGYGWRENLKFKDFILSRTFRLMPLHLVMLMVFILLEFGRLFAYKNGFHFNDAPFSNLTHPNEIIPNLLLLQSWLPHASPLSWNSPSWSISIEYYMYIIFFLSLFAKEKQRYLLWFFISISMFTLLFLGTESATEILRGLSCFFAGALTYLFYKQIESRIHLNSYSFTVAEFIILILVVWIISSDIRFKSLIATLLFSLQVFIFAFEKGFISKLLKEKIFSYLGKLSYSIYMVHSMILFLSFSIFMIIQKIFKNEITLMVGDTRYIDFGNPIINNLLILIILGITIVVSSFTYQHIEQKGKDMGMILLKRLEKIREVFSR